MDKIRGVVFGVGKYLDFIKSFMAEEFEIIAYMDNNTEVGGVYSPREWKKLNFDKIVICVANYQSKFQIVNQLLDLGVEKKCIGFIEEYLRNYNIAIDVAGKDMINFRANNVVVQCKNEIEYMIAHEVLANEEYGFHTHENYFVIDIGMNIGCTSLYFASKDNVTAVYGFEPYKEVYDKALSNIAMNNKEIRDKVNTYNIALSGKDSREQYIAHEGIMKSAGIKKMQDGAEQSDNIIEIITKQTSSILNEIFEKHVEKCLMKIDCEGAEYGILDDLINSGGIGRVDTIIMEWHVGKYRQLEKILGQAGFKFVLNKNNRDFGMCYAWR